MTVIRPSERASDTSAGLMSPYGGRHRHGVNPPVALRIAPIVCTSWKRCWLTGSAGHIGVAPAVVADHVPVGEHPPLERAAGVIRSDVLADLEERRHRVLALQYVQERRGGRRVPRPVVERERDVVDLRRPAVHER